MKTGIKLAIIASQLVVISATTFAIYKSCGLDQIIQPGAADVSVRYQGSVDFLAANTTRDSHTNTTDTVSKSLADNYIRLHGVNMGWYDAAYPLAFHDSSSYGVFVKEDGSVFDFSGSYVRRVTLYKAVYSTVSFKLSYRLKGETSFTDSSTLSCTTENKEYEIKLDEFGIYGIEELRIVSVSGSNGCFSKVTLGYRCV